MPTEVMCTNFATNINRCMVGKNCVWVAQTVWIGLLVWHPYMYIFIQKHKSTAIQNGIYYKSQLWRHYEWELQNHYNTKWHKSQLWRHYEWELQNHCNTNDMSQLWRHYEWELQHHYNTKWHKSQLWRHYKWELQNHCDTKWHKSQLWRHYEWEFHDVCGYGGMIWSTLQTVSTLIHSTELKLWSWSTVLQAFHVLQQK